MRHKQTDSLAVAQKLIVGVDMAKAEFAAGQVWAGQYSYQGKHRNDAQTCTAFLTSMEQCNKRKGPSPFI